MSQSLNTPYRHSAAGEFLVVASFVVILVASVYLHQRHLNEWGFLLSYSSLVVVFCVFSLSSVPLVLTQPLETLFHRIIVACVSGAGLTFFWFLAFHAYVFLYELGHPRPG
jgi:hypothetical protein